MPRLTALLLAAALLPACGSQMNARTCTAYEAVAEPARALCHRACDAIPGQCPWRNEAE